MEKLYGENKQNAGRVIHLVGKGMFYEERRVFSRTGKKSEKSE